MNKSNIENRLVAAWRRERLYYGTKGVFNLLLWGTVLLAISFVLDFTLHLPGSQRLALIAVNAAILLAILYWTWLRRLKLYDSLRVALQVEGLYTQFKSLLVSYVQFSTPGGVEGGASPALIDAMRQQAVAQSADVDFGKIVRFRTLRNLALATLVVLALAVGFRLWKPVHCMVFLARMVSPTRDVRYPTVTHIRSISGDLIIQQGHSVTLRAMVNGVIPEKGYLTIRPEKGSPETVPVPAGKSSGSDTQEFAYRLNEISRDFTYSFRVGDDYSEDSSVKVVAPPVIEPRVELVFPEYTARPPKQIDTLSFDALAGSKITWHLKADRPLAKAFMIPETGAPIPMEFSADGSNATVSLPADKSFTYGFRWEDRRHKFLYEPEVRYAVRVVPDGAPRVVLISPAKDEVATIRKPIDIEFDAKDDFGVTGAQIVYKIERVSESKTESAEQRVPIKTFAKVEPEVRDSFQWDVQTSIPTLAPGDVIAYAVEVADSHPGTPTVGRSATRRWAIVSPEEFVRMTLEKRTILLKQIDILRKAEQEALENLRTNSFNRSTQGNGK